MAETASFKRYCIEGQGFCGYDDQRVAELDKWLRISTGLCMTLTGIGTYFASWQIVLAVAPFAFLGAIMKGHPFDVFYNHGIRHMVKGQPFPDSPAPRRFTCAIATAWLLATAYAFYSGSMKAGYALGIAFTITAATPTFIGFCIPSFLYGLIFGSPVEKYRQERLEQEAS